MQRNIAFPGLLLGLRQILAHGLITLLAVAIAFSLPQAAQYVLYQWWPSVENDANLLLATEVCLASALVLLLNFVKIAWDNHQKVNMARLAALAYAKDASQGWWSRWREAALIKRLPAARDVSVLTLTGYDVFVDKNSGLRRTMKSAYEIRVMLVNPVGEGVRKRVDSLPPDITLLSFHTQIEATIAELAMLRKMGKKITLKFYEQEPFWKVIVLGDHAWVQHCHSGFEVKHQPEYVFSLQHHNPRQGLFVPFYMHFLNQWNTPNHPEYDFETNELVYRDEAGNEFERVELGVPINGVHLPINAPFRAAQVQRGT